VLVTLIVVLPIAAAAIALLTIAALANSQISEQLGEELVRDATARVTSEIRNYIRQAVQLSDLYTRRLQSGKLSATDLKSWEPMMFDDLATSPDVASICFGNPRGDATYLQRAHGRVELGIADGSRDCAAIEWQAHLDGRVDRDKPLRTYRYDPRERPWYTAALAAGSALWTPVYFWFGETGGAMETGSGYTRPIEIDGKLAGVLTIDVTLGAVSEFLRRQPFATHGAIFIVDDLGMLVAASQGPVTSPDGKRLLLAQSNDAAAQAVANAAPQTTTSVAAGNSMPQMTGRTLQVAGLGPSRASFAAFNPFPGAHWRVITVLPESAFLSHAQSMSRRALILASASVLGAIVVGLVFSRRLSRPLMKLIDHVGRIGAGDFDARLELEGARELQNLATETNRMAAGLRHRMELEKSVELATLVQQSLLPQAMPRVPGLEIYGHSRYCDATGGDYLDFVDVANLPRQRAFIAVGDVTGHGLGAALLMATARASVRTAASGDGETLSALMFRVNNVLSRDARHGLFMTMLLMLVYPQQRRVTWVSAGPDPAIVYDPATDEFFELEGGDLILGVQEDTSYQDFTHGPLPENAVMFVGTDGVWEARRKDDQMFGKDRLRDVLRDNAHRTADEIAAALERSIDDFIGDGRVHDDVTYVVVKFLAKSTRIAGMSEILSQQA
jgi:sigma-B regulation protein RsbU (phosphoserine phosphatase)